MSFLFGRRKTPQEMLRQNQRALNKAMRDLDRERQHMEQQEKKIIADIKKMAKQGQMVLVCLLLHCQSLLVEMHFVMTLNSCVLHCGHCHGDGFCRSKCLAYFYVIALACKYECLTRRHRHVIISCVKNVYCLEKIEPVKPQS